ncbi:MAG: universal stress protein [Proteobacteria bacterium]|nr:universal stress protein [Pseudomonadota bacterium]
MTRFDRIVVAVDFSEHSSRAIEMAVGLAVEFGARVDLVHAFDIPVPLGTPYEVAIPERFLQEARQAAGEKLEAEAGKIAAKKIEVATHLAELPAASAIARVAEEVGADLIVMGTRGNAGLKHVLLGSVAERTLRQAPCSVLTVK